MPGSRLDEPRYVFGEDGAHEQHQYLAEAYDPLSTARLAGTGVTDGWHCLEVGAGGGSVAVWLAERVAPTGEVLATDLEPRHIPRRPKLTVLRHDVVTDPLPENGFDLIHARLVLRHLPRRAVVLGRLLAALKPGGWLQLDEFDTSYQPCLLGPDASAERLFSSFLAAKDAVMAAAGVDGAWGRHAGAAMRRAGFTGIDVWPQLERWQGGSPGLRLLAQHTYRLREGLLAGGMTDGQLQEIRALLADPSFCVSSSVMYSVQGRRPR
ncbi:class I SAM-dependent methyltransferase [Amycolatopsis nigrescens]|uniref:class I SAM-dependent methyltransferase n=1 Tax=Amycolatopsis nigrescens TaxID=381445 RepID=UPI000362777A|nr:class I SAM-dependent methyltransferase [Amycolatopsis nigrescens]